MMRQRQQKILEHIQEVGIASIADLAQMFDVSPFTIRRDINYLGQARLLAQVKGGAQRIETPGHFREARLPKRMQINLPAKEKIAQAALQFIQPGDTIFLDGSSTIICLARAIAATCRDLTIVTNSVLVTLEMSEAPDIRVMGLGGVLDRETFSYVAFDTDALAESLHLDKAFFSCTGFVPDSGTFENAAFNRPTKRLIAQHADKVFLLIDSSKFGRHALAGVLSTAQLDVVITENLPNQQTIKKLSTQNVQVVSP